MRKTHCVTGVTLALALGLAAPDAKAQFVCAGTWATACASVSVTVDGDRLLVTVFNGSLAGDRTAPEWNDARNSVLGNVLLRITGADFDPTAGDLFWACRGTSMCEADLTDANFWPEWTLTSDGEFTRIGIKDWTELINSGTGACRGLISPNAAPVSTGFPEDYTLPCDGNGDFELAATFVFDYGSSAEAAAAAVELWATQFLNVDAFTCYPPERADADPGCESDWAVVPEPVTMTLLATGLVGMGGAALARRRRRDHDVGNGLDETT